MKAHPKEPAARFRDTQLFAAWLGFGVGLIFWLIERIFCNAR
jgi:hypothetical protein